MAAPQGQEKGVQQILKRRCGIDFSTWKGVNKENDPGAIDDAEWQLAENVRIDGNDVSSRGGQSKAYDEAAVGCIYGMIDIDKSIGFYTNDSLADANAFIYVFDPDSDTYSQVVDNPNASEVEIDLAVGSGVTGFFSTCREANLSFRGNLYTFGEEASLATGDGFYLITPPQDPTSGQDASLTRIFGVAERVSSYCLTTEIGVGTDGTAVVGEILYFGTITGGKIYRWDGTTLTEEASGIGSERIIMGTYRNEPFAAATDTVVSRNDGAWDTSYAVPVASPWNPVAMKEYVNDLFIAGVDDNSETASNAVLRLDGSTQTLSVSFSSGQRCSDLEVWDGTLMLGYVDNTLLNSPALEQWDGSSWSQFVVMDTETAGLSGALLAIGSTLYWWFRAFGEGSSNAVQLVSFTGGNTPVYEFVGNTSDTQIPPQHMFTLGI